MYLTARHCGAVQKYDILCEALCGEAQRRRSVWKRSVGEELGKTQLGRDVGNTQLGKCWKTFSWGGVLGEILNWVEVLGNLSWGDLICGEGLRKTQLENTQFGKSVGTRKGANVGGVLTDTQLGTGTLRLALSITHFTSCNISSIIRIPSPPAYSLLQPPRLHHPPHHPIPCLS